MARVWCIGEALIDFIPVENGQYMPCPGGAPANVAVAVSVLGGDAAFVGGISVDAMGQTLRQHLTQQNVNLEHIQETDAKTAIVLVSLDNTGDRSFQFYRDNTADLQLSEATLNYLPIAENDVLHCCSNLLMYPEHEQKQTYAFRRVKSSGGIVSMDVNLRLNLWSNIADTAKIVFKHMKMADLLKVSDDEWLFLCEQLGLTDPQLVEALLSAGVQLVVLTHGGGQVNYYAKAHNGILPVPAIEVVDTTGAGDAFIAGLLNEVSRDGLTRVLATTASLEKAIQVAISSGAKACQQKGALSR